MRHFGIPFLMVALTLSHCPAWAQATQPSVEWPELAAVYNVDTKIPLSVTETPQDTANVKISHLEFTGARGGKVSGLFVRPKADGVYPCVLFLHGLTRSKEDWQMFGEGLLKHKIAVLALDAPLHGERKPPGERRNLMANVPPVMREGCGDYRRALDYLGTRKDVDNRRIGLIGYSMGAFMGAILGGVDTRIKALALCVGGDLFLPFASRYNAPVRNRALASCPSLFIGHIAPHPIFMLNGKQDTLVPKEATERLYRAAKEPKQIRWYDSGHILPPEALRDATTWIAQKLRAQYERKQASDRP